jgi:hypothetical protein
MGAQPEHRYVEASTAATPAVISKNLKRKRCLHSISNLADAAADDTSSALPQITPLKKARPPKEENDEKRLRRSVKAMPFRTPSAAALC